MSTKPHSARGVGKKTKPRAERLSMTGKKANTKKKPTIAFKKGKTSLKSKDKEKPAKDKRVSPKSFIESGIREGIEHLVLRREARRLFPEHSMRELDKFFKVV